MKVVRVLPFPGLAALPPDRADIEPKIYEFKAITPVFGAGVAPGKLDRYTQLRGTTVRGHLRFWWRVTCGRKYQTVDSLRRAETTIWGSASEPSRVVIQVAGAEGTSEISGIGEKFREPYPLYALFPFKPTDLKPEFAEDWKTLRFNLLVRTPEAIFAEVNTALWAWANFGGIGGRTRRGCGALFCARFAPQALPHNEWVSEQLAKTPVATGPSTWPRLIDEPLMGRSAKSAVNAWVDAMNILAAFRQSPPIARRSGAEGRGFGRSNWPEADSLRAQSGNGNRDHMKPVTIADPSLTPAFPRAELGLPYQVKFKERPDNLNDCEVLPEGSKRMASPFIVRPLAIGPKGDKAVPMILCLDAPPPARVRVMRDNNNPVHFSVAPRVRDSALASYTNSPMKDRSARGSALEAFLRFAKDELAKL